MTAAAAERGLVAATCYHARCTRSSSTCGRRRRPRGARRDHASSTGGTSATTCSSLHRAGGSSPHAPARPTPSGTSARTGSTWREHVSGAPDRRGLRRLPVDRDVSPRGLCGDAPALRGRRPGSRCSSRQARPGRTSSCSSARAPPAGSRGTRKRPTWLFRPASGLCAAGRAQGPVTNAGAGARAVAIPGRSRRGLRGCVSRSLLETSTARSPARRTGPSRRSPTATTGRAASRPRRARGAAAWVPVAGPDRAHARRRRTAAARGAARRTTAGSTNASAISESDAASSSAASAFTSGVIPNLTCV